MFNQFFSYQLAGLLLFAVRCLDILAAKITGLAYKVIGYNLIVLLNNQLTTGDTMNLSVDNPINCSLAESDKFGNIESAATDAPPVWSLADASMGSLVAAADGMSAVITPSGKLGALVVNVSASVGGVAVNGSGSGTMVAGAVAQIVVNLAQ